jgi:hypothetical protein
MPKLIDSLVIDGGKAIVMLAFVAVTAACGTDSDRDENDLRNRDPKDLRCRMTVDDGSCQSEPVSCPITIPQALRPTSPHCPLGADLIPIEEDDCAYKFICID